MIVMLTVMSDMDLSHNLLGYGLVVSIGCILVLSVWFVVCNRGEACEL
jgi:hypothetical protein